MSSSASMRYYAFPIIGFLVMALLKVTEAQIDHSASSPAPLPPPSNDSAAIDQGIAYVLLLVALAVTYMLH